MWKEEFLADKLVPYGLCFVVGVLVGSTLLVIFLLGIDVHLNIKCMCSNNYFCVIYYHVSFINCLYYYELG